MIKKRKDPLEFAQEIIKECGACPDYRECHVEKATNYCTSYLLAKNYIDLEAKPLKEHFFLTAAGSFTEAEYFDNLIKLCLEGLTIDGGHHKQWFLEEILKMSMTDLGIIAAKKEFEWDEGIPN